jgi:hypothetical protein
MTSLKSFAIPALAAVTMLGGTTVTGTQADAGSYSGPGGRTAVWVYIRKHPAEDIWEACRRVYNRDVYQVRGAGETQGALLCRCQRGRQPARLQHP